MTSSEAPPEAGVTRHLDRLVDQGVTWASRLVSAVGRPTLTTAALAELRRRAAASALEARRPALAALSVQFQAARAAAAPTEALREPKQRLTQLATEALADMRAEVDRRARGLRGPLGQLDRLWRETHTVELIDRPGFSRERRVRLMTHLDELNVTLGVYEAFLGVLSPFFSATRPTRILDLAAGHGGFLLHVADLTKGGPHALELVASDLVSEYLEIGRAHAERRGLAVDFRVQDALDTSNLSANSFDLLVCTQSLHHFPPGLIAVLTHEALRIASRAVVLIDGTRSKTNAAVIPTLGLVRYRDLPFTHDAWVSLRKFFVPEELELLARVGAMSTGHPPQSVSSRFLPPGHLAVVLEV